MQQHVFVTKCDLHMLTWDFVIMQIQAFGRAQAAPCTSPIVDTQSAAWEVSPA